MVAMVIVTLIMIVSGSLEVTIQAIHRQPVYERPPVFQTQMGQGLLALLGLANYGLMFGIAIYLGITWWPMVLIALFVAIPVGLFLPPWITYSFVIVPLYVIYSKMWRQTGNH